MGRLDEKVIKVGVQGPKKLDWYEPHELNGRDPAIFTVLINDTGSYTRCGPYCLIDYQRPRYRGPRGPNRPREASRICDESSRAPQFA